MIASCGLEIKIHEWPEGKLVSGIIPPRKNNSHFKSISWSNTGKQLLAIPTGDKPLMIKTNGDKDTERIFTTEVLEEIKEAESVAFSRNSEQIATFGSASGDVSMIDLYTRQPIKTYAPLPSSVTFLNYTHNDILLAAGCKSGQIFLYNTTGNVTSSLFIPFSYSLSSMMFHPTRDNFLAASSKEGVVTIWDVRTNTTKFQAKNHTSAVTGIAVSVTEEVLATAGLDRRVNIYDLRTKELIFTQELSSELTAITCSPIGEEFAVATTKGRIFSLDKRQPNFTQGSFGAQKGSIKSILFDTSNSYDKMFYNLNSNSSAPILVDEDSSTAQFSNIESDTKTQASGDFTSSHEEKSGISRIPGGMDDGIEKQITEQWVQKITINTREEKKVPVYQLIDDSSLANLKQELIKTNREIMLKFMEEMTTLFLKIRMSVSREFCLMETSNNKRWQEFNVTLLKLAGFDETKREADIASEAHVSEESDILGSRQQESIYSPAKTKMTNYSHPKSTALMKQ